MAGAPHPPRGAPPARRAGRPRPPGRLRFFPPLTGAGHGRLGGWRHGWRLGLLAIVVRRCAGWLSPWPCRRLLVGWDRPWPTELPLVRTRGRPPARRAGRRSVLAMTSRSMLLTWPDPRAGLGGGAGVGVDRPDGGLAVRCRWCGHGGDSARPRLRVAGPREATGQGLATSVRCSPQAGGRAGGGRFAAQRSGPGGPPHQVGSEVVLLGYGTAVAAGGPGGRASAFRRAQLPATSACCGLRIDAPSRPAWPATGVPAPGRRVGRPAGVATRATARSRPTYPPAPRPPARSGPAAGATPPGGRRLEGRHRPHPSGRASMASTRGAGELVVVTGLVGGSHRGPSWPGVPRRAL
jgi:hypothetical protein